MSAPTRFVDRDMRPCDWETEARQSLAARESLSSFGYQRLLKLLVYFAPQLFEERDRLRAQLTEAQQENEAWRALVGWQTADNHVAYFEARPDLRRPEPETQAYRGGTILAHGPTVDVAQKLKLTAPSGPVIPGG